MATKVRTERQDVIVVTSEGLVVGWELVKKAGFSVVRKRALGEEWTSWPLFSEPQLLVTSALQSCETFPFFPWTPAPALVTLSLEWFR